MLYRSNMPSPVSFPLSNSCAYRHSTSTIGHSPIKTFPHSVESDLSAILTIIVALHLPAIFYCFVSPFVRLNKRFSVVLPVLESTSIFEAVPLRIFLIQNTQGDCKSASLLTADSHIIPVSSTCFG